MPKLHIPLESIRVASPCNASWEAMEGDGRARFCLTCHKHVYNLSAMSRADAEALVQEHEGRLCVYFYQRQDGTVITDDCPVGLKIVRRPFQWLAAGAVMLVVWGMALVTGQSPANAGAAPVACPQPAGTSWLSQAWQTVREMWAPKPYRVFGGGTNAMTADASEPKTTTDA